MAKVKNWMMDMDDAVCTAIEAGAESVEDVYAHVGTIMPVYDKNYVKELFGDFCADMYFKHGGG